MSAEPCFDGLMNGVKRSDFDENIRCRWNRTVDEFEPAKWNKKQCATRSIFLPALAGRKAQRSEKLASRSKTAALPVGRRNEMPLIMSRFYLAQSPG